MNELFVIRNQLGHYWGKSKMWVDGNDPKASMRLKHHDEALNTLFELSSKDVELRGEILPVELNSRGYPVLEVSAVPLPEIPAVEDAGEIAIANDVSATPDTENTTTDGESVTA
ncbi:MAG: hypothetical protein ACJAYC_001293 [Halieaceae bacterium]|jgi:hypothetical protein